MCGAFRMRLAEYPMSPVYDGADIVRKVLDLLLNCRSS